MKIKGIIMGAACAACINAAVAATNEVVTVEVDRAAAKARMAEANKKYAALSDAEKAELKKTREARLEAWRKAHANDPRRIIKRETLPDGSVRLTRANGDTKTITFVDKKK